MNIAFTDFSDGKELSQAYKNDLIKKVLYELENKNYWSIATGNFIVIGLKYPSETQIIISENYKISRL